MVGRLRRLVGGRRRRRRRPQTAAKDYAAWQNGSPRAIYPRKNRLLGGRAEKSHGASVEPCGSRSALLATRFY